MKPAKEYFITEFLADDIIRPLNHDLINQILKFKPKSVFEFGCGQGKNLALLREKQPKVKLGGFDIGQRAIWSCHAKDLDNTWVADESDLKGIKTTSYDVCFTCSVLDHIAEEDTVKEIVNQFKRISKKGVVICETLADRPQAYYYPHDYKSMGLKRCPPKYDYWSVDFDNYGGDYNHYHIWQYKKVKKKERK